MLCNGKPVSFLQSIWTTFGVKLNNEPTFWTPPNLKFTASMKYERRVEMHWCLVSSLCFFEIRLAYMLELMWLATNHQCLYFSSRG